VRVVSRSGPGLDAIADSARKYIPLITPRVTTSWEMWSARFSWRCNTPAIPTAAKPAVNSAGETPPAASGCPHDN